MTSNRLLQIILFVSLGGAALAAGVWLGDSRQQARVQEGATQLEAFSLPDSTGKTRHLMEWDSSNLLINFWATWCAPCREEIPLFVEAQKKYGADGLQVIGIALDKPQQVARYMEEMKFNYPSLVAEIEGMDLMAQYGNAGGLPFTLAVDRKRKIVGKRLGRVSESQMKQFIERLLGAN